MKEETTTVSNTKNETKLWLKRMGHFNQEALAYMQRREIVQGCLTWKKKLQFLLLISMLCTINDMLRGLKLIIIAKTALIFLMKKESSKPIKSSSTKFGSARFCIRS
ncbi:hypothetical protein SADUNF_Sadunf05G0110200 [Salix dunnii]|uniref:GAG-pre-integrase domain-containing protein n=1 Tax=Salix dunnii TaxID=1413687 RepID=A0A835KAR1_9ROSI|nr:hypothetical protein SADUNF_Sadunf05G0110200 [Salix dunnii]